MIGVHPGPFKLRELILMAEARERSTWRPWSVMIADFRNAHRGSGKDRVWKPSDFMPGQRPPEQTSIPVGIDALKAFLPKRK